MSDAKAPTTVVKTTVVKRIVGGLEHTLDAVNGAQSKVHQIFPSDRDSEDRRERPEATGLSRALTLLSDLRQDLSDLHSHLDKIV